MKPRTWFMALSLATVAFAATALVACGDDDNGGTQTPSTTGTPAETATTSPTSQGTPTTPAETPTPGNELDPAAIQVLVDYYRDLDSQEFEAAYGLWADDGAASGHSLTEFQDSFSDLDSIRPVFGQPEVSGSSVTVPVTALSVVSGSNGNQTAMQSDATVTLDKSGADWKISAIDAGDESPISNPPAELAEPEAVLNAYYQAINDGNPTTAYSYWESTGESSGQEFADFADGYAATQSVEVHLGQPETGAAAGSVYATIPTVVVATKDDGTVQVFCGSYDTRRANIPPFDMLGWRLYSADIQQVTGATAGDAQDLLANNCQMP